MPVVVKAERCPLGRLSIEHVICRVVACGTSSSAFSTRTAIPEQESPRKVLGFGKEQHETCEIMYNQI